jgi:ribonuclease-3
MIAPELDRGRIEGLIGTRIGNPDIYRTAFTHKSALKQYALKSSYETLEFLGDAVLGFVVTKHLYDNFQKEDEGFLTKARTKIVRGKTLAAVARRLDLGSMVLMDDKGMRHEWFKNEKILEDIFEALVGAIYLDLGIIWAREFVTRHVVQGPVSLEDDNYKDIVMRWCQAQHVPLPVYEVLGSRNGFDVSLKVLEWITNGTGRTKKEAEQAAALKMMASLNL